MCNNFSSENTEIEQNDVLDYLFHSHCPWPCWFSEQANENSFALNHIVQFYNQQKLLHLD